MTTVATASPPGVMAVAAVMSVAAMMPVVPPVATVVVTAHLCPAMNQARWISL